MCSAISLVSCHRPRSVWVCVLCSAPVGGTAEKRGLRPAHLRLCACRERASTDLWAISLSLYRHQLGMEGPTGGRSLRRLVTRVLRWEDPRPEGMPKYGCREIADLGSRCSRGCWIRACLSSAPALPCSAARAASAPPPPAVRPTTSSRSDKLSGLLGVSRSPSTASSPPSRPVGGFTSCK